VSSSSRNSADEGAWIGGTGEPAGLLAPDDVTVPEAAVAGRGAMPRMATTREPCDPVRCGVALDRDRRAAGRGPRVEPRHRSSQRPATRPHRRARRLPVAEQPGPELQHDLRLVVAAHLAEHGVQTAT